MVETSKVPVFLCVALSFVVVSWFVGYVVGVRPQWPTLPVQVGHPVWGLRSSKGGMGLAFRGEFDIHWFGLRVLGLTSPLVSSVSYRTVAAQLKWHRSCDVEAWVHRLLVGHLVACQHTAPLKEQVFLEVHMRVSSRAAIDLFRAFGDLCHLLSAKPQNRLLLCW